MKKINYPTVFKSIAGQEKIMSLYQSLLEKWPVPKETKMIATRHGNTFVICSGANDAKPLVLLHGAGTNSTMWIGELEEYSKHYRIFAVDIIGEAGKSDANRPSWDGPAYEEWLTDVLDELGIEKTSLMGISQGAWSSIKFAVANSDRVEKLVLISPGGIVPDNLSFIFKVLPLMMLGSWGIRRIVKMLYADQTIPEGVTEVMITMMKHFKPRVGVLPLFSDEELSKLSMPTLLIAGTKDKLRNSKKIAGRLEKFLSHLSVKLIEGGGHVLNDVIKVSLPFFLEL